MKNRITKLFPLALLAQVSVTSFVPIGRAQKSGTSSTPAIPKTWDDTALAAYQFPLAVASAPPFFVSSEYYYSIPVALVYKNYPVYEPGKEPPGYVDWLKHQEPQVVFDAAKLKTERDWIKAGEVIFDLPLTSS